MGAVAKSCMRKCECFLVYEEMRKNLVINVETVTHDFATAPVWISIYMRKILISFFISVGL